MEPLENSCDVPENGAGKKNDDRLLEILLQELDKEIAYKMGTVCEISDSITKCQENLDRLRKEAVTKFYMGFQKVDESTDQPSIHPSVKKLIGKRPVPSSFDNFMRTNIWQWKRETRNTLIKNYHLKNRKSKSDPPVQGSSGNDSSVKPCYVPPNIPGNPQENSTSRGNTKKMHMRVLVGNVAKEVVGVSEDSASHKWMVYVRSAPGSLSLERHVSKVRFYLHPSYKPHDVITVPNPPFTLNRRGWGEFPLRIQLYFENPWNKTVDIIHNLKFGGTRSGLQTRCTETFADLWIYPGSGNIGNELSTEADGSEILWLASDMLREVVPAFSKEVTCHKCQTTSYSTDSYCCPCVREPDIDHEELMADDHISFHSSHHVSQDLDLSDSNDSFSGAKFLGRFDISNHLKQRSYELGIGFKPETDLDLSEIKCEEIPVQKQIDTSYCDEFVVGYPPSVTVKEERKETENRDEVYLNQDKIKCDRFAKSEPKLPSNPAKFIPNNSNSFEINSQSGSLDFELEPSDILDALEIKQEVKEENVYVEISEPVEETEIGVIETEVVYDNSHLGTAELLDDDTLTSHNYYIPQTSTNSYPENLIFSPKKSSSMEEIPIIDFIDHIVEEIVVELPEPEQYSNNLHVGTTNFKPSNSCKNSKTYSLSSTGCDNTRNVKSHNTNEVPAACLNNSSAYISSGRNVITTISCSKTVEHSEHDINCIVKEQEKILRKSPIILNVGDKFKTEELVKPSKLKGNSSINKQRSLLLKPKNSVLMLDTNKAVKGSNSNKFTVCNIGPKKIIISPQSLLQPNSTEIKGKPAPSLPKTISLLKPAMHKKPQQQAFVRNPLSLLKPAIQMSQDQLKSSNKNHLTIARTNGKNGTYDKPLDNIKSPLILSNVPLVQNKSPNSLLQTYVEKTNCNLKNCEVKSEQTNFFVEPTRNNSCQYVQKNMNVHIVNPSFRNIQTRSLPVISLKDFTSVSSKESQLFNQSVPNNVLESPKLPTLTKNFVSDLNSKPKNQEGKILISDILKTMNISHKTISEHSPGICSESRVLDVPSVMSSNSLHCNLSETHKLVEPNSRFEKKIITAVYKDTLNSITNKQVLYYLEQVRLLVNTCQFEDPEYCVRWLTRGLPLVHSDAALVSFKVVHPYCAPSHETYCSWPKTKRAANQWLRAKTVARFLTLVKAKGSSLRSIWTTHTIYRWCQTHGYSPDCTLEASNESTSIDENVIQRCFDKTPPVNVIEWMASVRSKTNSQDQEVDVVGLEPDERVPSLGEKKGEEVDKGNVVLCGQPWVRGLSEYTRREAEQVDARLGLECLIPDGAPQALATTLLSLLTATFAEDLLRRALSAAYLREGSCIATADVCQAICERSEFDIFTQQGLQVNALPNDYLRKIATPKEPP